MNLGSSSNGFTVWFTGMSGAGKSTLAQGLANRLRRLGKIVDVMDGPEVEQILSNLMALFAARRASCDRGFNRGRMA